MVSTQHEQSTLPISLIVVFTIAVMIMLNTFITLHRSSRRSRALTKSNSVDTGVKSIGDSSKSVKEKSVDQEYEQDDSSKTNVEESIHNQARVTSGIFDVPDTNKWRCACEGGFLPPGLLKTFGRAESVYKMGVGDCYHKT